MNFGHIELFVADPMKSLEFYRDVLQCSVEDIQHERFVWLNLGGQAILLRPGQAHPGVGSYDRAPAGFVLYTDDLPATRRALEERGLHIRGTDGSENCLTFSDPDGHWFQLVDPGDH